jgi:hypothetical protein
LVRRARAVVTLSGTAIIEAFILQRPVIFTSKSRFGGFGFGSFTQEFLNFGEVLAASPRHLPSDEEIIKMLSAIHRSCVRCKFAEPLGDPDVLKRENIEVLASAILKHLSVG